MNAPVFNSVSVKQLYKYLAQGRYGTIKLT